jgi:hypothetical protein
MLADEQQRSAPRPKPAREWLPTPLIAERNFLPVGKWGNGEMTRMRFVRRDWSLVISPESLVNGQEQLSLANDK